MFYWGKENNIASVREGMRNASCFPQRLEKNMWKYIRFGFFLWVFRSPHLFPAEGERKKRWWSGKSVIFSFVSFSLAKDARQLFELWRMEDGGTFCVGNEDMVTNDFFLPSFFVRTFSRKRTRERQIYDVKMGQIAAGVLLCWMVYIVCLDCVQ